MSNADHIRGAELRSELLGTPIPSVDAEELALLDAPYVEFVTDNVWRGLWGSDALDRRTRALLDIAIIGALGRSAGLMVHIGVALRCGCTVKEIREALMHVTVFAGASAGYEAFKAAKQALEQCVDKSQD